MKLFGREIQGFAQWIVFLLCVLLIASGLCGVQWAIATSMHGGMGPPGAIIVIFGIIELIAMLISSIGIVALLIMWPVSIVYDRFSKPAKDTTLKLFDDKKDPTAANDSDPME